MKQGPGTVIGIDTGGTFTDFVVADDDGVRIHKEPSTPDNPARAVLQGMRHVLGETVADVVHGSTVATNALLERKGARTALITTAGFEDVLEIGRQTRSTIYDLHVQKPAPLVPHDMRIGIAERVGPHGEVLETMSPASLRAVIEHVSRLGAEAIAICLLHSYANPEHERAVRQALDATDAFVTASHEVLPEFREYERSATTVVNAYVGPVMARYLSTLATSLDADRVRIMQSNGGIISLAAAQQYAVQTILSGPAGGAVGGFELACRAGYDNVITFDMGGTSTDVCLCPGVIGRTSEAVIGELPIRVPVIDVHTVGAGGGSIAYRDPGGSLRVGPESAGADPGPICYGRNGTAPTVTDANLLLGRLSPDHFLGGTHRLTTEPVRSAMDDFAKSIGLTSLETAEGIIRVANATMERAIRVITLERGFDPRDFTLVCFGGAGAMHAAELASNLSIPRVLVPRAAGILSALGMLLADFVRDYSQTVLIRTDQFEKQEREATFAGMEERARREYDEQAIADAPLKLERSVDMRYVGQGYELTVPASDDLGEAFHREHEQRYGYADTRRPTEIVNVRVRAIGRTVKPPLPERAETSDDPSAARAGDASMVFDGSTHGAPIFDRALLRCGNRFRGPALVVEYSTTTVVPPGIACSVDRFENLILEPATATA